MAYDAHEYKVLNKPPADSDFTAPRDGLIVVNGETGRLSARVRGAWVASALSADADNDALPTDVKHVSAVALPSSTVTTIATTASLAVGTWLVTAGAQVDNGASASASTVTLAVAAGTATATLTGKDTAAGTVAAASSGDRTVSVLAVVTVAGTLIVTANPGVAGAGGGNAVVGGYTAVKVA